MSLTIKGGRAKGIPAVSETFQSPNIVERRPEKYFVPLTRLIEDSLSVILVVYRVGHVASLEELVPSSRAAFWSQAMACNCTEKEDNICQVSSGARTTDEDFVVRQ